MLPTEKDAALPHTDFNGGGGDRVACKVAESVEDQDEGNFSDIDSKVEIGKPYELLGAALAAKNTTT